MDEGILGERSSYSRSSKAKTDMLTAGTVWPMVCKALLFPVEQCIPHPAGSAHLGQHGEWVYRISNWPLSLPHWEMVGIKPWGRSIQLEGAEWHPIFWNFVVCFRWHGGEVGRRQKDDNIGEESFQWENPSLSGRHKANKRFSWKRELLSELLVWLDLISLLWGRLVFLAYHPKLSRDEGKRLKKPSPAISLWFQNLRKRRRLWTE